MEKTILAVDDDPAVLLYVEEVLQQEGCRVLTADGGVRALKLLETESPDLLLLDVQMPGMGGYELLKALRARDQTSKLPVIFLTVKDTTEDEKRGLREGVIDYLSKDVLTPERVDILRYRLRNFFAWQENERLRGVLATIVSANHEINNPLMVIQGNADLLGLKEAVTSQADSRRSLERIRTACKRVKKVLDRISNLATFEGKAYLDGVEMLDLDDPAGHPEKDGGDPKASASSGCADGMSAATTDGSKG
ncbi:MAG: response regulator [Candidatus Latescibacteria bacterium]|jgi:CheY-like chemotaxis protein|nr:response regulator [Candidatus Latescibacterota bacterium]